VGLIYYLFVFLVLYAIIALPITFFLPDWGGWQGLVGGSLAVIPASELAIKISKVEYL